MHPCHNRICIFHTDASDCDPERAIFVRNNITPPRVSEPKTASLSLTVSRSCTDHACSSRVARYIIHLQPLKNCVFQSAPSCGSNLKIALSFTNFSDFKSEVYIVTRSGSTINVQVQFGYNEHSIHSTYVVRYDKASAPVQSKPIPSNNATLSSASTPDLFAIRCTQHLLDIVIVR